MIKIVASRVLNLLKIDWLVDNLLAMDVKDVPVETMLRKNLDLRGLEDPVREIRLKTIVDSLLATDTKEAKIETETEKEIETETEKETETEIETETEKRKKTGIEESQKPVNSIVYYCDLL